LKSVPENKMNTDQTVEDKNEIESEKPKIDIEVE
jgi:hypothetical protein